MQGMTRKKTDIVKFVRYCREIIFRRSICRYIHSTRIVTVCCFQYQNRLRKRLRAVLWKNLSATYSDRIRSKGKTELFESWGYTIDDSENLKSEYEKQAKQKYMSGDYSLQLLDVHGQRLTLQ